jgi:transcriptional regulator with XRE-family HTH domain
MNVGERITYFREQRGITTNKLANMAGLSQSFIRDVELSNKSITIDNLAIVCDALKITLKDFFDEPPDNAEAVNKELTALLSRLTSEQKARLIEFLRLI